MVLRPIGSRPAAVYWRRRAVLIAIVVIIIVLLAKACSGGSSPPTGHPPTTEPSASTTPAPITTCGPRKLTVAAMPAAASTKIGEPVRFTATVQTTGSKPCRLLITPSQETWTVTSGDAQVWTDGGCQPQTAGVHTVLRPHRLLTLQLTWNGTHTGANCQAGVEATPGTYHVTLTLGSVVSSATPFVLTQA